MSEPTSEGLRAFDYGERLGYSLPEGLHAVVTLEECMALDIGQRVMVQRRSSGSCASWPARVVSKSAEGVTVQLREFAKGQRPNITEHEFPNTNPDKWVLVRFDNGG